MESKVIVVLHNPGGQLKAREVKFHPVTGLAQNLGILGSSQQLVALFVVRDCGPSPETGGPWWDTYSGHEMFGVSQDGDEDISVIYYDVTPTNSCKVKTHYGVGNKPASAWRPIEPKLAQSYIGGSINWDVVDGGDSSTYDALLQDAKVLVGHPAP